MCKVKGFLFHPRRLSSLVGRRRHKTPRASPTPIVLLNKSIKEICGRTVTFLSRTFWSRFQHLFEMLPQNFGGLLCFLGHGTKRFMDPFPETFSRKKEPHFASGTQLTVSSGFYVMNWSWDISISIPHFTISSAAILNAVSCKWGESYQASSHLKIVAWDQLQWIYSS